MIKPMFRSAPKAAGLAIALSLGLAGCGGMATNRSMSSIHQPVVERVNYTLDVTSGPGGLSYPEQRRVAGWFEAMGLRYGDRISIDDPVQSDATRTSIEALASRYGLLVSTDAPTMAGYVNAGSARIVITRSKAQVPGCPDWSANSDTNFNNATSSNFGCATNSNIAAMVADPEHLLKGAHSDSNTVVMSSTKAIDAYRQAKTTGSGKLQTEGTSGN